MSLSQYRDAQAASDGVKAFLAGSDGKPSEDWLVIRSYRSHEFMDAYARIEARHAERGTPTQEQLREDLAERRAALVAAWSDAEPCTPESAKKLLMESSRLGEWIDRFAAEDEHFFGSASSGFVTGQTPR